MTSAKKVRNQNISDSPDPRKEYFYHKAVNKKDVKAKKYVMDSMD